MDCTDFNEAPEGGDCIDPNTYPGAAKHSDTACMTDADEDGYGDAYASGAVVGGMIVTTMMPVLILVRRKSSVMVSIKIAILKVALKISMQMDMEQKTVPSNDTDDDEGESGTSDDCDGNDSRLSRSKKSWEMVSIKIVTEAMLLNRASSSCRIHRRPSGEEVPDKSSAHRFRHRKSPACDYSFLGVVPS